jgi:hypothetical protein
MDKRTCFGAARKDGRAILNALSATQNLMIGEADVVAGRKRKPGVRRSASGKSRGEPEDVIRSVALAYRAKEIEAAGIGSYIAQEARYRNRRTEASPLGDPLNGFTLGLLRQRQKASREDPTGITQAQYDAGEKWANLCRQHALIMGYSLGSARSPSLSLSPPGQSCVREPDEAVVLEIRRQWSDCYRALMDTGVALRRGVKVALICWDVCVNNRNIKHMSADDFGNLRAGLNALAHVLKLRR